MRINDWSSDVCSSDLPPATLLRPAATAVRQHPRPPIETDRVRTITAAWTAALFPARHRPNREPPSRAFAASPIGHPCRSLPPVYQASANAWPQRNSCMAHPAVGATYRKRGGQVKEVSGGGHLSGG